MDDAAKAYAQIMFSPDEALDFLNVLNVAHPQLISWDDIFLPGVAAAGLVFEPLSSSAWLAALKAADATYRLMDFFQSAYAADDGISSAIVKNTAVRI